MIKQLTTKQIEELDDIEEKFQSMVENWENSGLTKEEFAMTRVLTLDYQRQIIFGNNYDAIENLKKILSCLIRIIKRKHCE